MRSLDGRKGSRDEGVCRVQTDGGIWWIYRIGGRSKEASVQFGEPRIAGERLRFRTCVVCSQPRLGGGCAGVRCKIGICDRIGTM